MDNFDIYISNILKSGEFYYLQMIISHIGPSIFYGDSCGMSLTMFAVPTPAAPTSSSPMTPHIRIFLFGLALAEFPSQFNNRHETRLLEVAPDVPQGNDVLVSVPGILPFSELRVTPVEVQILADWRVGFHFQVNAGFH